ncbi:MAG: tryptophan-rich sensory protein [Gemmatimonadota bacterium]
MTGLVLNVLGFLALVLVVNLPAGRLGLVFDDAAPDTRLAPPGWLVVAAWLVLFPAMGAARWLVDSGDPGATGVARAILVLAVLCATYAYYTLGLARVTGISPAISGLVGNATVIALAIGTARAAAAVSPPAAWLLAAVAAWTAFASISVVPEVAAIRRGRWRGG